jgi:hypothetical protein
MATRCELLLLLAASTNSCSFSWLASTSPRDTTSTAMPFFFSCFPTCTGIRQTGVLFLFGVRGRCYEKAGGGGGGGVGWGPLPPPSLLLPLPLDPVDGPSRLLDCFF